MTFLRRRWSRSSSTWRHVRRSRWRPIATTAALDPAVGTVYRQRTPFEDSVTRLAETISGYLDLEEQAAQSMLPHYFEKQKTDGVDHQIYVGGSLLEDGHFDPLYLKSLRLWQLMVICGIAARADRLTGELPCRCRRRTSSSCSTRRSRSASASTRSASTRRRYDIRYEIVKKRIDKALDQGHHGAGDAAGPDRHRVRAAVRGRRSTAATSTTCATSAT